MHSVWNAALDLLFPARCCACTHTADRPGFCADCRALIETPAAPLCTRCGVPFHTRTGTDHQCGRCLTEPPRFQQARACTLYDADDTVTHPLKSVLQRYKYAHEIGLSRPLGALLIERCPLPLDRYDLIVPVPLHVSRLRWRGFNQSQHLALGLSRAAAIPLDAFALERIRPTRPQVELHEAERRRNVARAFHVARPERVEGRRLLLVDDVYTTGATVNECSRVLLRAGAAQVDVLVLARAVLH